MSFMNSVRMCHFCHHGWHAERCRCNSGAAAGGQCLCLSSWPDENLGQLPRTANEEGWAGPSTPEAEAAKERI